MDYFLLPPIRVGIFLEMDISARLDMAMDLARIKSQSELSRRSEVPQATISRILKGGGKRGPESATLKKLADACGVNFEWLNEGIGEPQRTLGKSDRETQEFVRIFGMLSKTQRDAVLSVMKSYVPSDVAVEADLSGGHQALDFEQAISKKQRSQSSS